MATENPDFGYRGKDNYGLLRRGTFYPSTLMAVPLGTDQDYGMVGEDGKPRVDGLTEPELTAGLQAYAMRQFVALGGKDGTKIRTAIVKKDKDGHILAAGMIHQEAKGEAWKPPVGIRMLLKDMAINPANPAVIANFFWKEPELRPGVGEYIDLRWQPEGVISCGYYYNQWSPDVYSPPDAMLKGVCMKYIFGNLMSWKRGIITLPEDISVNYMKLMK